jgi:hypothetical protein
MKLINYTSVPDTILRAMIRHCQPPGVHGFDISFKNSGDGCLHARCYHSGTCYHKRNGHCPPLVVIHVPDWYCDMPGAHRMQCLYGARHSGNPRRRLGRDRQSCRGYMPSEAFTDHERLVGIIAHELRHIWQRMHPRGYRVWGARGQYSERDADAYEIHMTRTWRRLGLENSA